MPGQDKIFVGGVWKNLGAGGGGGSGTTTSFDTNCKTTMSADLTVTTSTWTKLTFNTAGTDTNTEFDTATNAWVCKTAGTYIVIANIVWVANTTGVRSVGISETGIAPVATEYQNQWTASSAGTTRMSIIGQINCVIGGTITIWGWHNRGSNLDIDADGSYFGVFRIA
jgi:hypothetical protein